MLAVRRQRLGMPIADPRISTRKRLGDRFLERLRHLVRQCSPGGLRVVWSRPRRRRQHRGGATREWRTFCITRSMYVLRERGNDTDGTATSAKESEDLTKPFTLPG